MPENTFYHENLVKRRANVLQRSDGNTTTDWYRGQQHIQCEIILAPIEGPNVLVAANSVQKIVNKSPNSNTMMQQMLSLAKITTGTRSSSLKPERWIFC